MTCAHPHPPHPDPGEMLGMLRMMVEELPIPTRPPPLDIISAAQGD